MTPPAATHKCRVHGKGPGKKKPAAGVPFNVAALIPYARNGIVSRTLVENRSGTLTVFTFDKGQGLSEHTAPFDAIVIVLDGVGEFTVGGKPSRVRKGELLVMPARIPHAVRAVRRFKMLLVMLRSRS